MPRSSAVTSKQEDRRKNTRVKSPKQEKAETEHDDNDELSSLGDASPIAELDAFQRRQRRSCRMRGMCSFLLVAVYTVFYTSLSSNPKIILISSLSSQDDAALYGGVVTSTNSSTSPLEAEWREKHVSEVATSIATIYKPAAADSWCIDSRLKYEQAKRRPMGLCYLRIPMAFSTTLAGINMRISRNFAKRQGLKESCIRHDGHTPGLYYQKREQGLSYLWTMVRKPDDRALSRIANSLAKQGEGFNATDGFQVDHTTMVLSNLQQAMDMQYGAISEGRGGFQVQYSMLHLLPEYSMWNSSFPDKVLDPTKSMRQVQQTLMGYDFIGVAERFDESLVALQLLLDLDVTDVLYFSSETEPYFAKSMGTPADSEGLTCLATVDPESLRTPQVTQYLQSPTWWAQNYGDLLLHQAASQSLDQTILQQIGLKRFAETLKDFRKLKAETQKVCQPVTFPCSRDGKDQSLQAEKECYFEESGCGYPCLDAISQSANPSSEA